ncbi:hypothetical protein NMY22_g9498 [Coprinellus aureogranulatus]|nr:hypothetical protein NMY22_g9498 [Coprinellus aureogranulatus]
MPGPLFLSVTKRSTTPRLRLPVAGAIACSSLTRGITSATSPPPLVGALSLACPTPNQGYSRQPLALASARGAEDLAPHPPLIRWIVRLCISLSVPTAVHNPLSLHTNRLSYHTSPSPLIPAPVRLASVLRQSP